MTALLIDTNNVLPKGLCLTTPKLFEPFSSDHLHIRSNFSFCSSPIEEPEFVQYNFSRPTPSQPIPVHRIKIESQQTNSNDAFRGQEVDELLNCYFITSFHDSLLRIQEIDFTNAIKRFSIAYLRNWEMTYQTLFSPSLIEKQLISAFKMNVFSKLRLDEWTTIRSYLKKMSSETICRLRLLQSVEDFFQLIENYKTNASLQGNFTSSKVKQRSTGLLHQCLMDSLEKEKGHWTEIPGCTRLTLYILIYYPNFEELWDSTGSVILDTSLKGSIERYLELHPKIHTNVLDEMLSVIDS